MKINKTIAIVVLLFGLLVGGLVAGVFLSRWPTSVDAAPAIQQATPCPDDDDQGETEGEAEDEAAENADCEENEANEADEANEANETNEADSVDEVDEAGVSPDQTGITADQAKAAAEAANPGAKALAVELDRVNENGGAVIYEVELDNGLDVKVDAANGKILGNDQRDAD